MAYREYIGSRYVPLFGRKGETSTEWDNSKPYEPLTIVQYQGNSYTSRQYVPAGIPITNESYWVITGNYNAQIEAYRQEVTTYNGRISSVENALPVSEFNESNTVKDAIDEIQDTLESAGWITTQNLANNAVTTPKIADGAVTNIKLSNESVTENKIMNGAVTEYKIADDAVTNTHIQDGAISPDKLDNDVNKKFWARELSTQGTNMAVFGDSYTADNIANSLNAYWPKRVAEALNTTLFNYAIAGAGFGRDTQLISRQQTNCEAEMTTEQAQNTSVVICMAGCNDLLNDVPQANIGAGIANFINWAHSFFPYAEIYIVPFNWGFSKLSAANNALITNTMNSIMTYNKTRIHIIPFAWIWNLGIASRFQNEVHPNMSGYNQIAARILNAISGVEAGVFNTGANRNLSNAPGLNEGWLNYNCREGVLYVNGYIRPTAAGAHNVTIFGAGNLPAILSAYDSLFVLPLIDSTNKQMVGVLNMTNDGRLTAAFNSSVAANEVCCFNGSFIPEVGVNWSDYV